MMPAPFRLFGADLSPYSIKVRQILRFKGIDHEWIPRSPSREAEFARYARLPLIPVLVGADDFAHQDSTPIAEMLESRFPEPTITPAEPALAFLSFLVEDFGDEWVNKAMFHYRWSHPADQASAAARIVSAMLDGAPAPDRAAMEASVIERMRGRLHFVGSGAETGPLIERSFERLLVLLDAHLADRPYLFGGRPALGDFGLAAQLAQLLSDPTPGGMIRARAPNVLAWLGRMEAPRIDGGFEPTHDLLPTLAPFLRELVSETYLRWAAANAAAGQAGTELSVDLPVGTFVQKPQKYAARALSDLRKRRALSTDETLGRILAETGCETYLALPVREPEPEDEAAS